MELSKAGAKLAHNTRHYHAQCSYRSRRSHDNIQLSFLA